MQNRKGINSSLLIALGLAMLAHVSLLLIPLVKHEPMARDDAIAVRIDLAPFASQLVEKTAEPVQEQPVPEPEEVVEVELPPEVETAPVLVETQIVVPQEPPSADAQPAVEEASPAKLLSSQFDYQEPESLFSPTVDPQQTGPRFRIRERPSMADALNAPSLQLPFEDTRIYLVASYDPGLKGSVDRFFDKVTVPFGFTTKHGTRVQCGWILVIAGCSWGPVDLYYKKARRRVNN